MKTPAYVRRRLLLRYRSHRQHAQPNALPAILLRVYRSYQRTDGAVGHEVPAHDLRWERDGEPMVGDRIDDIPGHERREVTVIERRWTRHRHAAGQLHITCASMDPGRRPNA